MCGSILHIGALRVLDDEVVYGLSGLCHNCAHQALAQWVLNSNWTPVKWALRPTVGLGKQGDVCVRPSLEDHELPIWWVVEGLCHR